MGNQPVHWQLKIAAALAWLLATRLFAVFSGPATAVLDPAPQDMMNSAGYTRVALWNPMHLTGPYRQEEISEYFARTSVAVFPGTAVRSWAGEAHHKNQLRFHLGLHFGWLPSPLVNKSAGCAIYLERKRFPDRAVRQVHTPPKELLGRGGGVDLESGTTRLRILVAYFPPRPRGKGAKTAIETWKTTCTKLLNWLMALVAATPARFTPMVGCDINSGLGSVRGKKKNRRRGRALQPRRRERNREGGASVAPCRGPCGHQHLATIAPNLHRGQRGPNHN